MALLNLEYKYGTKDTLEKVFAQAVSESKGKQIYLGAYDTPAKASYACNCKRTLLKIDLHKNSNIDLSKYYTFDNDKNRLIPNQKI